MLKAAIMHEPKPIFSPSRAESWQNFWDGRANQTSLFFCAKLENEAFMPQHLYLENATIGFFYCEARMNIYPC